MSKKKQRNFYLIVSSYIIHNTSLYKNCFDNSNSIKTIYAFPPLIYYYQLICYKNVTWSVDYVYWYLKFMFFVVARPRLFGVILIQQSFFNWNNRIFIQKNLSCEQSNWKKLSCGNVSNFPQKAEHLRKNSAINNSSGQH